MRLMLAIFVLATSAGTLRAEEHSFWWRTRAQAACITDVVRLCHDAMPDEAKVTTCMEGKKDKVSASCASFYPGGSNAD